MENLCSNEKGEKNLVVHCTSLFSGRKLSVCHPYLIWKKIRSRGRRCLPRYCFVPVQKFSPPLFFCKGHRV
jgi:hypothetical protein